MNDYQRTRNNLAWMQVSADIKRRRAAEAKERTGMNEEITRLYGDAKQFAIEKHDASIQLHQYQTDKADKERLIEARESALMTDVCAEMNGDKPRFSNDTARKAEVAVRAASDPVMMKLAEEVRDLSESVADTAAERDYAHDMHRLCVAALRAIGED